MLYTLGHTSKKNLNEEKFLKKKTNFRRQKYKKIGQNIKFDYIIFYHRGIEMNSMEDTMLMSYVLDAVKKIAIIWIHFLKFI